MVLSIYKRIDYKILLEVAKILKKIAPKILIPTVIRNTALQECKKFSIKPVTITETIPGIVPAVLLNLKLPYKSEFPL